MALKTPFKVKTVIQIQRADNGNIIERTIDLSQVVQDAIINHMVTNGIVADEISALALIQRWRMRTIWIDESV